MSSKRVLTLALSGLFLALGGALAFAGDPQAADIVIRNGVIYDGKGGAPFNGGVAIRGERIVQLGDVSGWRAAREIDAKGLAIAPGFVNMLSWANESLIEDGRSLSDIKQGVTLEIFGEGSSMGPLTEPMKNAIRDSQVDLHYDITWTTLGEYLERLAARGVSANIASFVGAATVRSHEIGGQDRAPTPEELSRMQGLVRQAMHEGALGLSSALIYAPGAYAKTDELRALAAAAAESGGGYISHMRSEANDLLQALDELIGIARSTGVHAEAYHLKAAGRANWRKMQQAIDLIDRARQAGLNISANMYCYSAAGTALAATIPPWAQEGGLDSMIERLRKPEVRKRVLREMRTPSDAWENLLIAVGSPDRVLLQS